MSTNFYVCRNCGSNKVNCYFHIERGGVVIKNNLRTLIFETRSSALDYAAKNNIFLPIDIYATSVCEACQTPNQIYSLHNGFRTTYKTY